VLRQELVAGTFERLVMSPFGAVGSIFSLTLFPFMAALVNGLMIVLLAVAAFDLQVQWSTAALAVPIALLGALAFMPFGVAIAAAVLVLKQAASVGNFVVAGISIVAGLYFPVELLPSWVEWLSEVQPFTPAVELLRHVLVGTPLDQPAIEAVAKLAAFAVVLLPLATLLLGRALSAARRRGTIIEY
jgi:ABC-2 type transport system permease protein